MLVRVFRIQFFVGGGGPGGGGDPRYFSLEQEQIISRGGYGAEKEKNILPSPHSFFHCRQDRYNMQDWTSAEEKENQTFLIKKHKRSKQYCETVSLRFYFKYTVCPRSPGQFYTETYYIKWVKISYGSYRRTYADYIGRK